MKNVGQKLKERREELGYTLEEMSTRTKIQPHYLKAIENGDLEFFKDDLSYLRYFLRFYCQALQIDFEEIRNEFEKNMEDFGETQTLKKIQEQEIRQQSINKRIQDSTNKMKPERKKLDYSLISLILVISAIAVAGVIFFVKMGPSFFNRPESTVPPVVNVLPSATPEGSQEVEETVAPVITDKSELTITTVDGVNYEVRGWKENELISIRVEFGRDTWMRVAYNGVDTNNPASKIYLVGETMEVLQNAQQDLKITLHFGATINNKIYFNDIETALDPRFSRLETGQQMHFVLKGE